MASNVEDKFEIRTVTESSTALKKYILDALENGHFLPALSDVDCFLACDPTSLLVGELNGKPIAIAATFKYEEQYRHFGCFVVDEAYRGQGYGMEMTAESRRRSEPIGVVTGYSVPEMLENYEKVQMVVQHWPVERHIVDIPNALSLLSHDSSTNGDSLIAHMVKKVNQVDMKALCDYDTKIFGYKREKFVERLIEVSHARLAVNHQGEIVGYAAARLLYKPDTGYVVGPVFCESFEIAKSLLKEIFQELVESKRSARKTVVIDLPVVVNPGANELAKLLCGEILIKCMFVSCNGLPKSDFKKWFAVTSLSAG
jgi:GNAT superfamily N-acetyltransferase